MKKLLLIILCFFMINGCKQKEIEIIHKKDGYTSKEIGTISDPEISRYEGFMCGDDVYCLYNDQLRGIHYEIDLNKEELVEIESSSFKDQYRGEGYSIKYETKDYVIYLVTEEIRNDENEIEELIAFYYYADENTTRLLYKFSIIDLDVFIPRVEIYYDKELKKDIFAYNDENGYILNEIVKGELKQIKRIPSNDKYEVCSFRFDDNQEFYEICEKDEYNYVLVDEEEYKVGKNDYVWFSDDYVYQTVFGDSGIEMLETLVINRSTKEVKKLSEVCHHTMSSLSLGNDRYLKINDGYYSIFILENDEAVDIELPFTTDIYHQYYLIDENRILFTVMEEGLSFYLVTF